MNDKPTYQELENQIAELKQIEKKLNNELSLFSTLMENIPDCIYFKDINSRFILISNSHAKLFNLNSPAQVFGKTDLDFFTEEHSRMAFEDEQTIIRTGKSAVNIEEKETWPNGKETWVLTSKMPLRDKSGNIFGTFGISHNISERKKNEQVIKEQENQLRDLFLTKDKVFSIIAHDLRSPFNSILGFSELLIENFENYPVKKSKKFIEIISISAKKTLILLDNLLNWAQSQTGQISFKPEKVVLSSIIQEIFKLSNSSAKKKNILLNFQSEEIVVFADQNMIKTIIRNLIFNAIKFTNSNGKIDVTALQNDNFIEIAVSDNGVGMNEKTLNKLFSLNPNKTTIGTANEKGSGLGLILAKNL